MIEHAIVDRRTGNIVYRSNSYSHANSVWEKKKKDKWLSWYELPSGGADAVLQGDDHKDQAIAA